MQQQTVFTRIQLSKYPDIQISGYPNIQISKYPNIHISIYPYIHISKCPYIHISIFPISISIHINPYQSISMKKTISLTIISFHSRVCKVWVHEPGPLVHSSTKPWARFFESGNLGISNDLQRWHRNDDVVVL